MRILNSIEICETLKKEIKIIDDLETLMKCKLKTCTCMYIKICISYEN